MMKKLIILLAILACGVGEVKADVNIYIKPFNEFSGGDAVLGLYIWGDGKTSKTILFTETSTSGVYRAEVEGGYTGMKIVRMKTGTTACNDWPGDGNVWNKSADMSVPTKDSYYDFSSSGWDPWNNESYNESPTKTINAPYYVGAEPDIAPSYISWSGVAGTQMTDNNNLIFTKTVTGNLVAAGTYKFKIIDGSGNWLGNGGDADYTVNIATAGTYTFEYTYNIMTGAASVIPTKTAETAPTFKYNVWCTDASDAAAIITNGWESDDNLMVVDGSTASKTYENQSLTAQTYKYKIVKRSFNGETKLYEYWIGDNAGNNKTFTISKASEYNVTFSLNIDTKTPSDTETEQFTGYYIVGGYGTNAWTVGDALSSAGSVFSKTIVNDGSNYYRFVIVPNTAIDGSGNVTTSGWNTAIRPSNSTNDDTMLGFANYTNQAAYSNIDKQCGWQIQAANKTNMVFSYDKDANTWSLAPYFTRTINTSVGYSTFSSDYDVAIPGDVDVYYASDANGGTGKVTMTKKTNVVEANTGVLLYKSEGGEVRFTPASPTAADEASGNKLLPGEGSTIKSDANYDYYVLAKKAGGDICFSKLSESKGATVNKGKAYLQVSHGTFSSPSLSIFFDDAAGGTTAIDAVKSAEPAVTDGAYYNLAGQRVTNPTKGLYIVNGRKVVVK